MRALKSRDLSRLVSRNEDTNFLVRQPILVNAHVIQEVPSIDDVATVSDAWECVPREPATGIAGCIREAKVVVCGSQF